MSEVKVFKTINGEEIITEVVDVKETYYVMKEPATLVLQETETGVKVGLLPYMPYANGNIALYANSVMAEAIPADSLISEYNRVFGSGIVTPSQSIIVPK